MFGLTMDQFALLLAPVAAVALLLVIYFTRPGLRRLSGALIGGFFAGTLNMVLDSVAFYLGLWHYPFTHSAYGPLGFYIAAGLFYGAGMALIGWRINRRFGRRGVLIFLSCFAVYGPLRDYLGTAAASASGIHFLVFAPGPLAVLADALCWVGCVGIALAVMRLVAGPARVDRLARQPAAGL
jgi:hypothetical protein